MRTNGYIRQRGLTVEQRNAIDMLVTGNTDTETAQAVGVHRVTVTKWRNGDPWFQAELNRRRQEVWSAAGEQLRSLLPKAIDALESELGNPDRRLAAASQVIKLAGLTNVSRPEGPTEAEQIITSLFSERLMAIQSSRRARLSPELELLELQHGPDPEQSRADAKAAWKAVAKEMRSRLADGSPTD